MSSILVVTSGLRGIDNAGRELVRRLRAAGYRVHYHTPPPPPRRRPFVKGGMVERLFRFGRVRERGIEALGQEAYRRLLEEVNPDLVLLDVELRAHVFTTFAASLRLALISPWFMHLPGCGLPPLTAGLDPRAGRERIDQAWEHLQDRFARRRRHRALREIGNSYARLLTAYARRCNFPTDKLVYDTWPPPLTFRGIPILLFNSPALEFPYAVPDFVHYVGPMARAAEPGEIASVPGLEDLLKDIRAHGRKLIYATFSSMGGGRHTGLPALIDAVSKRPDWVLIVSAAGKEAASSSKLPANVHYFAWLPQVALLAYTDCCVNHAGINTINECLVQGIPMVIHDGGKHDQPGCAARIAYHQAGIINNRPADAEAVRNAIHLALTDAEFRLRVEQFQQTVRAEALAGLAEQTVEQLLTAPAPAP